MSGASVALRVASVATRADSGLPSEEQTSNTDIRARACPLGAMFAGATGGVNHGGYRGPRLVTALAATYIAADSWTEDLRGARWNSRQRKH